jgi:8-oxo-dGTP pyrophosphatase MutT (NUDIX family)
MEKNTSSPPIERHFTATAYVIHDQKVLLHYHAKLKKWLPPGGHVEENETPVDCVIREAYEETGLHIALIPDEHLWIDRHNAKSLERPFLCLLENIPAYGATPAHQHIDHIFVARPLSGTLHHAVMIRWFTLDEVLLLQPDEEIFVETQETIRVVLAKYGLNTYTTKDLLRNLASTIPAK